jgi:hypothetical protein
LFFISFAVIVSLVFINLFIAIILQGFEQISERESMAFNLEDIEKFRIIWARYDPDVRARF